ncbi:MAG: DUF4924 family protein [Paludibacteraceae bacterium]|nr:DUF4924 family protein [Paludibacteraceae bacterium]
MFIAHELRQNNIIEYVLYMWQIEDLIRALDMDIDRIDRQIIRPYPVTDQQRHQLREWYESLIDMMLKDGLKQSGHLPMIRNTVNDLEQLHQYLLTRGQDAAYNAKYLYVRPSIVYLKSRGTHPAQATDVETALIFMYGIMMLRRRQADISPDTARTLEEIRKWMILLNRKYSEWVNDEFKIE